MVPFSFPGNPQELFPVFGPDWSFLGRMVKEGRIALNPPSAIRHLEDWLTNTGGAPWPYPNADASTANREAWTARLHAEFSPVPLMIRAHAEMGQHAREIVDTLSDHYWNDLDGCVVVPEVAEVLAKPRRDQDVFLGELSWLYGRMVASDSIEAAEIEHALGRLLLLADYTAGHLSEESALTGMFVVDYLLLQRAFAEDMHRAVRSTRGHEHWIEALDRAEGTNALMSSSVRRHVREPARIWQTLTSASIGQARFLDRDVSWTKMRSAATNLARIAGPVLHGG